MPKAKKSPQPTEIESENTWHYRYPVGFWMSRRSIKDIKRYRSLIWYFYNYAGDMLNNPDLIPLQKLIGEFDESRRYDLLKREINKMVPIVVRRFGYINAPTGYRFSQYGKTKDLDIVVDIFRDLDFCHQARYEVLVETIHRTLGYYEYSRNSVRRRWTNPLYWIAWVVNLPITVMMYTGVNVEGEKTSTFYYWFLQILMGILLTLIIVKLGISIDLLQFITRT